MLKRDHGNEWHQEQRRGVAQPGSALAWGARGRGFKSRRPDQLAEMVRNHLSAEW
jgi:hypothetical protein